MVAAESEAKPRKGVIPPVTETCVPELEAEDHGQSRRTWAVGRGGVGRLWRLFHVPVLVLCAKAVAYIYVVEDLLQPPEALAVRILSGLFHAAFAMLLISWFAVAYHGPGRVPADFSSHEKLPEPFVAALAIGRFCQDHPAFGADNEWCGACGCWRPPFASHCSSCHRCSVWMDHHWSCALTCVGSQNMRCYLQYAMSGQTLLLLSLPSVVVRLASGADVSGWLCLRLLMVIVGSVVLALLAHKRLDPMMKRIYSGWPFKELHDGFLDAFRHAQELHHLMVLGAVTDGWATQQDVDRLGAAIHAVQRGSGIRGLLLARGKAERLAQIFGEAPGIMWFFPAWPGGLLDPLRPTEALVDVEACAAWADLAAALGEYGERRRRWETEARAKLEALEQMAHRIAQQDRK